MFFGMKVKIRTIRFCIQAFYVPLQIGQNTYRMIDFNAIPSPCYVMEEELLRRNLALIKSVKERAGVNIILAFKAFAMWKAFPIVREYIPYSTASSKF